MKCLALFLVSSAEIVCKSRGKWPVETVDLMIYKVAAGPHMD